MLSRLFKDLFVARTAAQSRGYSEFLEFLLNNREQSPAQLLQDLFALYFSELKKNGYFVDFGATDGIALSNTYNLEKKFGWSGIVAEPLPSWHGALRKNRACHIDTRCVYSQTGLSLTFVETFNDPELSGLQQDLQRGLNEAARKDQRTFEVSTISLTDLLDHYSAPKDIDYMSIDTEGSELEILKAFDFSRHRVSLITVEHNYVDAQRTAIKALLERAGFVRVCEPISRWDDWYVSRDNPVLARFARA